MNYVNLHSWMLCVTILRRGSEQFLYIGFLLIIKRKLSEQSWNLTLALSWRSEAWYASSCSLFTISLASLSSCNNNTWSLDSCWKFYKAVFILKYGRTSMFDYLPSATTYPKHHNHYSWITTVRPYFSYKFISCSLVMFPITILVRLNLEKKTDRKMYPCATMFPNCSMILARQVRT